MSSCYKFQHLFIDALYHNISSDKLKNLEMHLRQCSKCAKIYTRMQETLIQFDKYQKYEPSKEFWDMYWIRLEQKFEQELNRTLSIISRIKTRIADIHLNPAWNYAFVAAVTMLIIGIFIGKYYFTRTDIAVSGDQTNGQSNAYYSQSVAHAKNYLERSKTLLLGFMYLDPRTDSDFIPNFSHPKLISQQLLKESAEIKSQLEDSNEHILHELIIELDNILLQIANLEEEYDLDAVELIQGGIKRKGIIFKINLEKILDAGQKSTVRKNSEKKQTMKGL